MLPVIGIVSRINEEERFANLKLHQEYIDAVIKYKGNPLIICKGSVFNDDEKKRLSYWLKQCDAIVITGGYHPTDYDYYVLEYALKHDLPILGICLGMQVMATYKSKEQLKLIGNNSHLQDNSDYSHYIDIEQDSHLSMILGNNDHIKVNSRHLEYVNSGGLFKVVAKSDDGLVEAIENPNHPFQIGVQWHPESMISYDDKQAKLWQTFIEIASRTCK